MEALGLLGVEDKSEHTIQAVTWQDWLKNVTSFLSLDISVHGTGWVIYKDHQLSWGRISLKATDDTARVEEFRTELLLLTNNNTFEYIFVEDVIGSCNFKTAKALYMLNNVIDQLIYENKVAAPLALHRVSNTTWKKNLKSIAGDIVVKGLSYTNGSQKEMTKACLESLGMPVATLKAGQFNDKQVEDICDALGMALGTIASKIEQSPVVKNKVILSDIRKGFKIKQFSDRDAAVKSANRSTSKTHRDIIEVDLVSEDTPKDLIKHMAKLIPDNPLAMYLVHVPVSKCCNLLLIKKLTVTEPQTWLLIYH